MTREEFSSALRGELRLRGLLSDEEMQKAVAYYEEGLQDRLEEGMSEEEALAELGSPSEIAQELCLQMPIHALITRKIQKSRDKSDSKTVWMLLAIFGSPLWLPLALAMGITILAVYFAVWAVIVSLMIAVFGFALAGVTGVITAVFTLARGYTLPSLAMLGAALCSSGIFLMAVLPMVQLCKKLAALSLRFARQMKSMFVRKKEVFS